MKTSLCNSPLVVIVGHYGSGKTNLALNLACMLKEEGRAPLLVDLDVVNPYFRSTDFVAELASEGITVIGPVFGGSNLDAPSLAPGIATAITRADREHPTLLDVGGDPDGARALARFAPLINQRGDALVLAVINLKRPETMTLEDNLQMLEELQAQSKLQITGLIGNTHLAEYTTEDTWQQSLPLLQELSNTSRIPLLAVAVPEELLSRGEFHLQEALQAVSKGGNVLESANEEEQQACAPALLAVKRLVTTVWQEYQ